MIYVVLFLLACNQANAWCWSCENAPTRSWSWWFGWGSCNCYSGWGNSCCASWSVSDWEDKVSAWNRGESCEAQPSQACRKVSGSPATASWTQTWKYPPDTTKSSQSTCEASGCLWVECFPSNNNQFNSPPADQMCSHCDGLWEGKCEWHHYAPGILAFAGPGEQCGFRYPSCPASEGSNCFCSDTAITHLKESWCDSGANMVDFCPVAMEWSDGRSQECSWNGWTVNPQNSGGIDATCTDWGATLR